MLLFEDATMKKALGGKPFQISDYPLFYPLSAAFTMSFCYVGNVAEATDPIIREFVKEAFYKVKRKKYQGQLINIDNDGFKIAGSPAPTTKPTQTEGKAKDDKPVPEKVTPQVETTEKPIVPVIEDVFGNEPLPKVETTSKPKENKETIFGKNEIIFIHEYQGCTFEIREKDGEMRVFNADKETYPSPKSPHARGVMKAYREKDQH